MLRLSRHNFEICDKHQTMDSAKKRRPKVGRRAGEIALGDVGYLNITLRIFLAFAVEFFAEFLNNLKDTAPTVSPL